MGGCRPSGRAAPTERAADYQAVHRVAQEEVAHEDDGQEAPLGATEWRRRREREDEALEGFLEAVEELEEELE